MKWYIEAITNYVNFKGRSRRKAYWMFVLMNVIISTLLSMLDYFFDIYVADDVGLISFIYSLFILLPSLAIVVRRLHDTGRSGWWVLISFVPIVGWIVLLVFMCMDSYYGENQYGECPKQLVDVDIHSVYDNEDGESNQAE